MRHIAFAGFCSEEETAPPTDATSEKKTLLCVALGVTDKPVLGFYFILF